MRSQVSARIAPMVACSADLPGSRAPSIRAKRRAESESRSANSRPRQVSRRRCLSSAQRSTVSQLRPRRPRARPDRAPRSAAISASSSGCASSHADARSRSSATGWSTTCGSNKLVCALRFSRIRTSCVLAFPMFSLGCEHRGYPKRRFKATLCALFSNIINALRVFGRELD